MKIIAGLGNPGRRYRDTRHNAGWMALDKAAGLCGVRSEKDRGDCILAVCGEVCLFRPLRYMNRSGPPLARLVRESGSSPAELLVLVDDMDLPLGRVRLRAGGSSGGHKGLMSVALALETDAFPRLRMGIGPRPGHLDGQEFVLSPFGPDEWEAVEQMTDRAARAALCWAEEGIEPAMNRFNASEPEGDP
ncbi:MAG: hypothetical protein AMK73_10075 [Planctomycetes bacterium SM23_32]|nr:MAG: hypothetical protein AMK73_10075 [Planctomycetes bacterium SM23_32]